MPNNERSWEAGHQYDYDSDDDFHTFHPSDEEEGSHRRPIIIISIVALILVFGAVVFLAYRQGMQQSGELAGEPPIIHADTSPDKVAPDNPVGTPVLHQDKSIYDIAGDAESDAPAQGTGVEHLLPRAEEPMTVSKPVEPSPSVPAASVTTVNPGATIAANSDTNVTTGSLAVPAAEPASAQTAQTEVQTSAPTPSAATAAPESSMAAASLITSDTSADGLYVAQLAALRDEASAKAQFATLQRKYPALLASVGSDIERADLGTKGIYFRLRAGPLEKSAAQALCAGLKAQGQVCLVRPK